MCMVVVLVVVVLMERKVLSQQSLVAELLRVEDVVYELRSENERRADGEINRRDTFATNYVWQILGGNV